MNKVSAIGMVALLTASCATTPKPPEAPDLVALSQVDPTIFQEIRYAGVHNFLGRPVTGYLAPKCMLTQEAAQALAAVQSDVVPYGLSLKVYDCYRPQRGVDDFVAWAKNLSDVKMKREFYPKVEKTSLFKDGYIAEKSGHSRGSTMDLTLVSIPAAQEENYSDGQKLRECTRPAKERFRDNGLDMGTGYDCFDPLAHTANPAIVGEQKRNRLLLKSVMEKHGFRNLAEEWWHFTLISEPYPDRYFDLPIQ
jgi:D-alanyl-D-alanine dipeptidase